MKWFGTSLGSRLFTICAQEDAPVGRPCGRCKYPIQEHDNGFVLLHYGGSYATTGYPIHRNCFLLDLGILTAHILHQGRALCFFSGDVPGRWPKTEVWVRLEDFKLATCDNCKKAIRP